MAAKTADWKEYTSEMGQYCLQDSRVTKEYLNLSSLRTIIECTT